MQNENFLEKLASQFGQNASVRNVYGDAVVAGDKTIIPVARVAYGLGGGYGHGFRKNKPSATDEQAGNTGPDGEGAGGGGGMYAKPYGVYEVTAVSTKFIPANNTKQLIIALGIGWLLRGWLHSKRRSK